MTDTVPRTLGAAVPAPPADDTTIWRYMDFTKFIALLEERALFFPRVAALADPFEGSFPVKQTIAQRFTSMLPIGAIPEGARVSFSPGMEQVFDTMRNWSVVSCWHISPHESAAMWRLYAQSGDAVAIRSTVGRLREALGKPPLRETGLGGSSDFHIGAVEYIDYQVDHIPSDSFAAQFFRKRRSFEHECELRALLVQYPITAGSSMDSTRLPPSDGVAVPIDPNILIDAVKIAPQAPGWYLKLVARMAGKYDIDATPLQSELDATPLY